MNVIEIKEELIAPDFTLPGCDNKEHKLSDFRGKKVVLYFYPKDNTSACTKEAEAFRDNIDKFNDKDVIVIGISRDSIASHDKFISKLNLPFLLLSDADEEVVNLYGVLKEKTMYGKKHMGIERSTFIIDENGAIKKIYRKVKVNNHINDVLDFLNTL